MEGRETPIGILPREEELSLQGMTIAESDLTRLLSYDTELWRAEIRSRADYLALFPNLPREVWDAQRRLEQSRAADAG